MKGDGVSIGSNSRGKGGSNSNSIDFFHAQAILNAASQHGNGSGNGTTGDLSTSHATVKDVQASSNSNSGGSVENKRNEVHTNSAASRASTSTNKKGKGKKGQLILNAANLAAAMEVAGENHPEIPMDLPSHNQDSNHSISRISPLRAPVSVNQSKKTHKGVQIGKTASAASAGGAGGASSSSGDSNKRKGVPRDINSVLKHVDAEVEDGPGAGGGDNLNLQDEPSPKAARLSLGQSAVGVGAGAGTESSQDGASHSLDITSEKDGSRGAAGGNRRANNTHNIQKYFAPQNGGNGQDLTNFFGSAAGDASSATGSARSSVVAASGADTSSPTMDESSVTESGLVIAPISVASSSSSSSATSKRGRGSKSSADIMGPPAVSAASSSLLDKGVMKQVEILKMGKEQAENKIHRMETELGQAAGRQKVLEDRNIKVIKKLEEVQREMAHQEARRRRDRLALDCVRLGKVSTVRTSATTFGEVWEEGYALKELNVRAGVLSERREELNRRRNDLASLKRKSKAKKEREHKEGSTAAAAAVGITGLDDDSSELDFVSETEAIQSHLNQLKKDESALSEERRLLEAEKAAHQKELKRCSSEDKSRFYKSMPCLHDRYLLVSMLGRGGFSEVWKALDLMELRDVAIKIHQLNPTWNEDRKNTYIRHVTREYTIHRDMQHPRVVQLFDVFEIDNNSFATVLELCRGIDLDEKLKRCRLLPEKDARTILLQIVSGLRYLNVPSVGDDSTTGSSNGTNSRGHTQGKRMAIIHYDLKPANILFDEMGDAKITDFGLSKIIDDTTDDESLELTSQGAGTYWYLPPECFAKGDENGGPRVSSKVDVWSVGVIFYQMLFGKRPFGEGKSQELVLREGVILNAHQVDFPPADKGPKVSNEAKDLIRACLTHNKEHRPDVHALCMHTYLSGKTKIPN